MNPENFGPHIQNHHSILWRNKMFEQPEIPKRSVCHKQMNEISEMGLRWRTRNNFVRTNYSQFRSTKSLKRGGKSMILDTVLSSEDKKQNAAAQNLMNSLIIDASMLQKSRNLVEAMNDLGNKKLLANRDFHQTKYPGTIKHEHIYNDYHWKQTNPGYSRNAMGGKHFTR